MKRQSENSKKTIWLAPAIIGALLIVVARTPSVLAQTNTFPSSGNVGIGTSNPASLLNLVGTNASLTFGTAGAADSSVFTIDVAASGGLTNGTNGRNLVIKAGNSENAAGALGGDLFLNPGSPIAPAITYGRVLLATGGGNVGIGTSSPASLLNLVGTNASLTFGTAGAADSSTFTIDVATSGSLTNGQNGRNLVIKAGNSENAVGPAGGDLFLNPGAPSAPAVTYGKVLLATAGGNVGIGTTAPTTKLHVAGDGKVTGSLTVDGNIAAKYQDVAEWVPASQTLPAGTVVTLDPTKSNHVDASSQPYDTRVAGVISEKPGITLGESGAGRVLVATTGRVRVKVDATRAPIQIGDLLVTSDILGVAMKSEAINLGGVPIHRPGTIIGKALETLAKGSGEILVLLSLQ